MSKKYYLIVAVVAIAAVASGTAGLFSLQGTSFWLGLLGAVLALVSIVSPIERIKELEQNLNSALVSLANSNERLANDTTGCQKANGEALRLGVELKGAYKKTEELTEKLAMAEVSSQAREAMLKEALAELASLNAAEDAVNEIALATIQECERLIEVAMMNDGQSTSNKTRRDELLIEVILKKETFAESLWLAKNWLDKMPSLEQLPTAVIRELVNSEAYKHRCSHLDARGQTHKELERLLARKYV